MGWFSKKKPTADGEKTNLIKLASGIVSDFGELIEEASGDALAVWDVSFLPHPKEAILNSMKIIYYLSGDPNMRESILVSAMMLARYQRGIGTTHLSPLPVGDMDAGVDASIAAINAHQATFEKWSALQPQIANEAEAMKDAIRSWHP